RSNVPFEPAKAPMLTFSELTLATTVLVPPDWENVPVPLKPIISSPTVLRVPPLRVYVPWELATLPIMRRALVLAPLDCEKAPVPLWPMTSAIIQERRPVPLRL